jgi:hypothetical protein
MKTLLLLLFVVNVAFCDFNEEHKCENMENIYLCDYSAKIYGKAMVSFAIISGSTAQIISFAIKHSTKKVTKIKMYDHSGTYKYKIKNDCSIYIESIRNTFYCSSGFLVNKKLSNHFYNLISRDFLKTDNKGRLLLLKETK